MIQHCVKLDLLDHILEGTTGVQPTLWRFAVSSNQNLRVEFIKDTIRYDDERPPTIKEIRMRSIGRYLHFEARRKLGLIFNRSKRSDSNFATDINPHIDLFTSLLPSKGSPTQANATPLP